MEVLQIPITSVVVVIIFAFSFLFGCVPATQIIIIGAFDYIHCNFRLIKMLTVKSYHVGRHSTQNTMKKHFTNFLMQPRRVSSSILLWNIRLVRKHTKQSISFLKCGWGKGVILINQCENNSGEQNDYNSITMTRLTIDKPWEFWHNRTKYNNNAVDGCCFYCCFQVSKFD